MSCFSSGRYDKHPFGIWYTDHMKGVLFMRKAETQGANAVQMTAAVLLGGLLALGIELVILLLGSVAISRGILKADAAIQLTLAACVIGCLIGGWFACSRWPTRRLLAGLAAGAVCFMLILAVGLLMSDDLELGTQALMELAACLCGGALAGLFSGRKKGKKKGGKRTRSGK